MRKWKKFPLTAKILPSTITGNAWSSRDARLCITTTGMNPERLLLDKLLLERDELDQMISILQRRLSRGDTAEISVPTAKSEVVIGEGELFGMSRADAAIALLTKLKRTLSTTEIYNALEESGVDMRGKNALSSLYTSLMRHSHTRRVAPNTWGLKAWYPHLKDSKRDKSVQPAEPAEGTEEDKDQEVADF
jgi:hypothetical protein